MAEWQFAFRPEHKEARSSQATWQGLMLATIALVLPWDRLSTTNRWIAAFVLVCGGLALLAYYYRSFSRRMAASALRLEDGFPTPCMYDERRITFDEGDVQTESSLASSRLQWAAMTDYELTDKFLVLCSGRHPVVAIPRRCLESEELARTMQWCKERIANAA